MRTNMFLIVSLSLILMGCSGGGGGGGGGGTTPASLTGTFVDAAVQGLKYSSTSHNGVTDVNGNYTCRTGETVEFYLRGTTQDVFVGDITCRRVVSPIELVSNGTKTVEDGISSLTLSEQQVVKNALRLLQTLDSDGDTSNGININDTDVDTLISALNIVDLDEDLGNALESYDTTQMTNALNTLVAAIGGGRTAVSEANAVSHFETTIENCTATSCSGKGDEVAEDEDVEEENEEVSSSTSYKGFRRSSNDTITEVAASTTVPTGNTISLASRYYLKVNEANTRDISFGVYSAQCFTTTVTHSLVATGGEGATAISIKIEPSSSSQGSVSIVEHSFTDESSSSTTPQRKEHSSRQNIVYSCADGKMTLANSNGEIYSNGQVVVAKLKNTGNSNNTMYIGGSVASSFTTYPNFVELKEYAQSSSSGQDLTGCNTGTLPLCGSLGAASQFDSGELIVLNNSSIEDDSNSIGSVPVFRTTSTGGTVVGSNSRHLVTKKSGGLAITSVGVQIEIDATYQLFLTSLVDGASIGEGSQCPQVSGTDRKCSGAKGIIFGASR